MHVVRHATQVILLALVLLLAACGGEDPETGGRDTILMVVTSHAEIQAGEPTGLWFEEFAVPYAKFTAAGFEVLVASPQGGQAPIDPRSPKEGEEPDAAAVAALADTTALSAVTLDGCVAVFFPGGHGTMFDLPGSSDVQRVVSHFMEKDAPAAFVCHGPAALVGATRADGTSVVAGRKVTAFTDSEERAVELDGKMPFLLETKLKELGAEFAGAEDWAAHVVVDGNLITGQNPASSGEAAAALLQRLSR